VGGGSARGQAATSGNGSQHYDKLQGQGSPKKQNPDPFEKRSWSTADLLKGNIDRPMDYITCLLDGCFNCILWTYSGDLKSKESRQCRQLHSFATSYVWGHPSNFTSNCPSQRQPKSFMIHANNMRISIPTLCCLDPLAGDVKQGEGTKIVHGFLVPATILF
jgi:hypothetical protein